MSPDLKTALQTLRSGEESARRQAVVALGGAKVAEALPALLNAVADESWPVRQAATEALTTFPPELLLPALETALRDDANATIRNAAMEIYVKLGPQGVPPLLSLLKDRDEEVRNFAAVMLGTMRDEKAVTALIEALEDPDVNVRQ